jgi:hypothetical protein
MQRRTVVGIVMMVATFFKRRCFLCLCHIALIVAAVLPYCFRTHYRSVQNRKKHTRNREKYVGDKIQLLNIEKNELP